MNPEDKPNIARVRSIFDLDDSEDESSGIADDICAILKATSPSNLDKSNICKVDTGSSNSSNTDVPENSGSDNTNVQYNTNLSEPKVQGVDFDSLKLHESSQSNSSSNYASSTDSDHNDAPIIPHLINQSDNEEENSSESSDTYNKDDETDANLKNELCLFEQSEDDSLYHEYKNEDDSLKVTMEDTPLQEQDVGKSESSEKSENEAILDNDDSILSMDDKELENPEECYKTDNQSEESKPHDPTEESISDEYMPYDPTDECKTDILVTYESTEECKSDKSKSSPATADYECGKLNQDTPSEECEYDESIPGETAEEYESDESKSCDSSIKYEGDKSKSSHPTADYECGKMNQNTPSEECEYDESIPGEPTEEYESDESKSCDSTVKYEGDKSKPDNIIKECEKDELLPSNPCEEFKNDELLPSNPCEECENDESLPSNPCENDESMPSNPHEECESDESKSSDAIEGYETDKSKHYNPTKECDSDKSKLGHSSEKCESDESMSDGQTEEIEELMPGSPAKELESIEAKPDEYQHFGMLRNKSGSDKSDVDGIKVKDGFEISKQFDKEKTINHLINIKSDVSGILNEENKSNFEMNTLKCSADQMDVEMPKSSSSFSQEDKLSSKVVEPFYQSVEKEKKTCSDDNNTDMNVDNEIHNLQCETESLAKETANLHDSLISDADMDVDNNEKTCNESIVANQNDAKSVSTNLDISGTYSSDNEDDLIIDETFSSSGSDLLGFKSGNVTHKKVLVEDIFTDTDSDVELIDTGSPKILQKKSILGRHLVKPNLDSNKTKQTTTKKGQGRSSRSQKQNLAELVAVFEKGWRREVVYSARNSSRADIYYFTPTGQKLRSTVEIENYLRQEGILDTNISSFSFRKEPLGVEAKYENVRHANIRGNNGDSPSTSTSERVHIKVAKNQHHRKLAPKSVPKNVTLAVVSSQHRKLAPRIVQQSYPTHSVPPMKNVPSVINIPPAKAMPPVRYVPPAKTMPPMRYIPPSKNMPYNTYVAPANSLTYTTSPLNSSDLSAVQQQSVLTPLVVGVNKEKTYHCTAHCSKALGRVPNLQCVTCLCLFHHECCFMPENTVNLIMASHAKFLCPNCYIAKSEPEYNMSFELPQHKDPFSFILSDDDFDEGLGSEMADFLPQREVCFQPITPIGLQNAKAKRSPTVMSMMPNATTTDRGMLMYQDGNIAFTSKSHPFSSFIPTNISSIPNLPIPLNELGLITDDPLVNVSAVLKKQLEIPKKNWVEDLNNGYSILKRIFSYLDLTDLLVLSQVCTLWKDLAYNPIYWSTVRLRNVCIKDWPKMIRFLSQRRTRHLDMRKMVFKAAAVVENEEAEVSEEGGSKTNIKINKDAVNDIDDMHKVDNITTGESKEQEVSNIDDNTLEMDVDSSNVPAEKVNDSIEINSKNLSVDEAEQVSGNIAESEIKMIDMASTSGCDNQRSDKRKLEDPEEGDVTIKKQKLAEYDLDYTSENSFLNEHDYYLDMSSSTAVPGQCVEVREEVVDSCKGKEVLVEKPAELNLESLISPKYNPDELPEREQSDIQVEENSELSSIPNSTRYQEQKSSVDKTTQFGSLTSQQQIPTDEGDYNDWHNIFQEISKLDCLERITLGKTDSIHLEILLFYCRQIQSLSVSNITSNNGDQPCFDPSYLMPAKTLKELRFICSKPFSFKSNFNFIKLPELKILMLKGLATEVCGWPYMGTNLTHLYLSPIHNFTKNNWENLANMTELVHLELESCSDDTNLCTVLPRISNLKRIGLYDWHIGSKLTLTLKRMNNIESLFIMPGKECKEDEGVHAGRVLVVVQAMKGLQEFQWGVQPSVFIQGQEGKIYLRDLKDETPRAISLESLEGYIKQRRPKTRITVKRALVSKFQHGGSNSVLNFRYFNG